MVDCQVPSVRVYGWASEVRGLRGVGYNGIRETLSELTGKGDQPLLSPAAGVTESSSVLPIDVHSIELVLNDIVSDIVGACECIDSFGSGVLSCSKSTHHQSYILGLV